MVAGLDQPGVAEPVRLLGAPVKLSRTPADCNRLPGPELGEHTEAVLRAAGFDEARIAALVAAGAVGGRLRAGHGALSRMSRDGMLKISELAERSGVSAGTIKHYLREGLLAGDGLILRTSRNMAWYAPALVERVKLIKRLQEERFMPLKLIRGVIESDPDRMRRLIELEDRILERAAAARETARMSAAQARRQFDLPANVLDRLAELEVLSPTSRGYDADDVAIMKAISRFRAGGYDEALGFTVYDTLRYRDALQPLVEEEVRILLDRLAGEVEPDRAVEIIASGAEPLRELVGAMHSKQLLAELRRQRRR